MKNYRNKFQIPTKKAKFCTEGMNRVYAEWIKLRFRLGSWLGRQNRRRKVGVAGGWGMDEDCYGGKTTEKR
jgi:hypothetical protein